VSAPTLTRLNGLLATIVISIPITIVALSVLVPVMVMLQPAVVAFPITFKEFTALVMRNNPVSSGKWCPGPITLMPLPMVSYRIPITIDPYKIAPGSGRNNTNYARRRRLADSDANG